MSSIPSKPIPWSINSEMHNRTQVMTKGLTSFYRFINSQSPKNTQKELTPKRAYADFRQLFPTIGLSEVSANIRPYTFGSLSIKAKIGGGTSGTVYAAVDYAEEENAKQHKALKFTNNHAELQTLQKLRNAPHCKFIVYLEKAFPGTAKGEIVLQFLNAGPSVYNLYVHGSTNIPYSHLKVMTKHVLGAIKHLKDHKVQHRDIKPENIVQNTAKNVFQLIDFGLSEVKVKYPYSIYSRPLEAYEGVIDDRSEVFALAVSIDACIVKTKPSFINAKIYDEEAGQKIHTQMLLELFGKRHSRSKWTEVIQKGCKDRGFSKEETDKLLKFLAGIYKEQSQRWTVEEALQAAKHL